MTELEQCNRFSNCRTLGALIGEMNLKSLGGGLDARALRQMRAQTSGLYRFWNFCFVFRSQRSEGKWGRKSEQNLHFLAQYES